MNLIHGISNHKGWVTITCLFASDLNPIPLDVSNIMFHIKGLVRGPARLCSSFTYSI